MTEEGSLTRSLTVLFGSFFIILSAILAATPLILGYSYLTRLLAFGMVILIAIAAAFVGMELYNHFMEAGLTSTGQCGIAMLVLAVPLMFVLAISILLEIELLYAVIGAVAYLFSMQLPNLLLLTSRDEMPKPKVPAVRKSRKKSGGKK